jgi:plastocyanin
MKKLLIAAALALTLSPLFALAHSAAGKTVIHMDEKGFTPKNVTIEANDSVVFENIGKEKHWPASNIHPTHEIYPEFDSMKGIEPGKSWEFTFTKPGIWKMHDHLFAQFGGTITVTKDTETTVTPVKKSFWQKITGFFSSLFVSKKNVKEPIASSKPTNDPSKATLTPELKKQAEAFKDIAKDSREIWSNEAALLAYMQKYGAKQTFAELDSLEKAGVGDCHQTAHKAGHFGLALFGNEILKECDLTCHSGCYHGATEEYFKINGDKDLSEGLNTLCASTAGNAFYAHQCYHGLGHGLMAWTNYDLPEALKTCDLLKVSQGSCWTGVFMENIVAGLATDKGDVHITAYKNDDPLYPCTIVDEKYKISCYFLQTSRMMQMYGVDFKKMADACSLAPKEYRFSCFQSMGRDVSSAYRITPERSIKECGYAPKEYRIDCLNGAVQDALWDISGQDTAITFCKLLTDKTEKDSCYNTIIPRMREVAHNDAEKQIFCGKVETSYRSICF